jgi:hypothetical protein
MTPEELQAEVERLRAALDLAERTLRLVAFQAREQAPAGHGPIAQIGLDAETGAQKARAALGETGIASARPTAAGA